MPTYVVLLNWTDQGVKSAKETVKRYEQGKAAFKDMGVTFRDTYWTVGPYDVVSTIDAPDDETLSAALLTLGGLGNVRSTTMRAFSADEMTGLIGRMP